MISWLRFLPYALSGLAVAAVWALWADRASLKEDNARLARELSVQALVAEQAALARDVARAEVTRYQAKAAEYDQLREQLLRGEDDEDLPDWFGDYLVRLLGLDTADDVFNP